MKYLVTSMWNNSSRARNCEILLLRRNVKWNLPSFAKRTFHICEADISQRSYFTCPQGQISLKKALAFASAFFLAGAEGLGLACRLGRCFCTQSVQRSPQETCTPRHSPSASENLFAYTKNNKHRKSSTCYFGRGRRDRTLGTRFWRPMLYQLSYTPILIFNAIWLYNKIDVMSSFIIKFYSKFL